MKNILFLVVIILALACKPEPKPIQYGVETCEFCRMTIVDKRYASQLVTTKGKNHKFDAIECMVNYMTENKDTEWSFVLVSDYDMPGNMINAHQAIYLQTNQLPSPMGGNINAFSTSEIADSFKMEYQGQIFQWNELKNLN